MKHPFAAFRLGREAHDLDLTTEVAAVARAGIPALVVGSASDTLATPVVCSGIARSLGAEYQEIAAGGHMWMLSDWPGFRAILSS